MRNTAASYYLWRGELMGFEYELAKRFAKQHKLRLEVVVPPNRDALLSWLREGRGDIAAGFWTGEPRDGMTWSRPYHYSQPYLVSRSGEEDLIDLAGLRGRRIAVPPDSPAWVWLASRQVENGYTLQGIDDDLVSEEIVDKVALGEFDLAVVDEHRLAVELAVRDDLRKQFAMGEEVPNHWAVRSEDVQLAKALDSFFKQEYRGTVYNITYKKYFENEHRIRRQQAERVDRGDGSLSPYDALVRKFGEEYLFDWPSAPADAEEGRGRTRDVSTATPVRSW